MLYAHVVQIPLNPLAFLVAKQANPERFKCSRYMGFVLSLFKLLLHLVKLLIKVRFQTTYVFWLQRLVDVVHEIRSLVRDRLENRRLGLFWILFQIIFLIFLMLFGAFVLIQALESLEGFAASLALPLRLGWDTDVGLLEQNALFFKELFRDWFEVSDLALRVVVMKLSGSVELVAGEIAKL